MTQVTGSGADGDMVAAVLRLTDLAARIEGVDQAATRRIEDLARDCAAAAEQVARLREQVGELGGRADGIEQRLAEVSELRAAGGETPPADSPGHRHPCADQLRWTYLADQRRRALRSLSELRDLALAVRSEGPQSARPAVSASKPVILGIKTGTDGHTWR